MNVQELRKANALQKYKENLQEYMSDASLITQDHKLSYDGVTTLRIPDERVRKFLAVEFTYAFDELHKLGVEP